MLVKMDSGSGSNFQQIFGRPTLDSSNSLTVPFDIKQVVMTTSGGGYYTIYWDYNVDEANKYGQKLSGNAQTWNNGETRANTGYAFTVNGKTLTFTTTSFFADITVISIYG